jgi:Divergent InlB B-repeat domain
MTLTATPASGSRFAGWGGLCGSGGTNPSCSVTGVAGANEVTARFDLVPQPKTTTVATTKPKPATTTPTAPAPGPPPTWKLVTSENVLFSVQGSYVSGHAEVRPGAYAGTRLDRCVRLV